MKRFTAFVFAFICLSLTAHGSALAQFDHTHAAWTVLLKKHLVLIDGGKASKMRYSGMAADRVKLKHYLGSLAKVSDGEFKSWHKNQQLAFLINAYNANMVEKILLRHPDIRSVWDYGKVFGNPFRDSFIDLFGRKVSLDNIEHDTIRAKGVHDDPRIHMAVNCASIGCPALREEAFTGDRIDAQLEEQAVRFLSDRTRNRYSAANNALEISEIFKWYSVDFTSGLNGIKSLSQFFAKYADLLSDDPSHQKIIRDGKAEIRHLDYDWGLNDIKK
jgi:hypothetical protein